MSLLDRINANPLPFALLLGVEFTSVEADAVAARMVVRSALCILGGFGHRRGDHELRRNARRRGGLRGPARRREGGDDAREQDELRRRRAVQLDARRPLRSIHRGRRSQIWQTRVETEDGKLIALATQTQMTL